MPDIGIKITGSNKVELQFENFPERARAVFAERIRLLTDQLEARVQEAEPDKTGKLRRETVAVVYNDENKIKGVVKVTAEFGKAAALEYGAHKPTKVRSHSARLDHVFGRLISPTTVMVSAFTRTPNIDAMRFLRGPLEEMAPEILAALQESIEQLVEEEA